MAGHFKYEGRRAMPGEVSWYIEKRVIAVQLSGKLTVEELQENSKIIETYIQNGVVPLILFIDLREVTKFPTNFKALLQTAGSSPILKTSGWIVMLSPNSLLNFFGVLASKVTQVPIRIFNTPEKAHDFIARNINSTPKSQEQPLDD
jgi:hypothetical protein